VFEWFNYILKDSVKPAILKNYINYEVMGSNIWKHTDNFNSMNDDTLHFYLDNVRIGQHYKLGTKPGREYIRQEIDFRDRSDTITSATGKIIDSIIDTNNGLTFTTAAVEKSFDINGSFTADLVASINKKDIDIAVAVYELRADGKYFYLTSTLQRASYARNRCSRQLLVPGAEEHIPLNNCFFTSRHINKGSRLVVVLSISKNYTNQVNYGSGKDISTETMNDAGSALEIKWFGSSMINIPIHW
jgi:predicted acyl esterase